MRQAISVTLHVTVSDERALRAAAVANLIKDGMAPKGAREYRSKAKYSAGDCLRVLLDPGISPPGCQIEDSSAEDVRVA